jgi:hypothetical protein
MKTNPHQNMNVKLLTDMKKTVVDAQAKLSLPLHRLTAR